MLDPATGMVRDHSWQAAIGPTRGHRWTSSAEVTARRRRRGRRTASSAPASPRPRGPAPRAADGHAGGWPVGSSIIRGQVRDPFDHRGALRLALAQAIRLTTSTPPGDRVRGPSPQPPPTQPLARPGRRSQWRSRDGHRIRTPPRRSFAGAGSRGVFARTSLSEIASSCSGRRQVQRDPAACEEQIWQCFQFRKQGRARWRSIDGRAKHGAPARPVVIATDDSLGAIMRPCQRSVRSPRRAPVGVGASHQPDHPYAPLLASHGAFRPHPARRAGLASVARSGYQSGYRIRMLPGTSNEIKGLERTCC